MTIERPMFPPRRAASPFRVVAGIDFAPSPDQPEDRPGPTAGHERILSPTGKNGRLRDQRHEVWRMAEAATRYWRVRLDLHGAIWWAQRMETPEGRTHPAINDEDRYPLVEKWRAAFVKQLLTPAWDAASVAWKQNALTRGKYEYSGLKPERLKHAIAEDLAFLAAHPVRQSNRRSAKSSTTKKIVEGYAELCPEHQQIVCDEVDRMLAGELDPANEGGRQ